MRAHAGTRPGLSFELTMDVEPRVVSVARRFIEESLERVVDDPDVNARVSMVAHELLENAAKYAMDRRARLQVSVSPRGANELRVLVQLTNRTSRDHLAKLRTRFAEMQASEDPFAYYFALMKRHAHDRDVSGLGLARIWAEGEMNLALETREDEVTIMASAVAADDLRNREEA
jgi:hypothetical protein